MSSSDSHARILPEIKLLCKFESNSDAFNKAAKEHFPELFKLTNITVYNCNLAALPKDVKVDAFVSPANSYGFMDGAYDDAISQKLSPNAREGYRWTTNKVQSALYNKWRGYAPPGSCTIIDVARDEQWHEIKRAEKQIDSTRPATMQEASQTTPSHLVNDDGPEHKHGCKYVALCPTMRIPQDARWDREIVFECVWALLCAIDTHNRQHEQTPNQQIRSILMTPLATGVGRVTETRWAVQCVLALKGWVDAVRDSQKWSSPEWGDVYEGTWDELARSHAL